MRVILFAGLLLLLCGCAGGVSDVAETSTTTLTYLLSKEPGNMDPHVTGDTEILSVLRQIYDTLVYRDPVTKALVPGLATQWAVSADGLIYGFALRQGVRFHDGTSFDAQAVAANLNRIVNPQTGSLKARQLLGPYAGYEIVDSYTIRIILSAPYAPLLDGLAQPYLGIASPTIFQNYSMNRYQFHQSGTGPFQLEDYVPGKQITLRRSSVYDWKPEFLSDSVELPVNRIRFAINSDPDERARLLREGEVEVATELLPASARDLTANASVRLYPVQIGGQAVQFVMNSAITPTNDVNIRRALLYATNRDGIIDGVYQRFSTVAWGPVATDGLDFDRSLNGRYAYDVSAANRLLSDANYRDSDNDRYLDLNGERLVISLIFLPDSLLADVALNLRDQWANIGIQVNISPVPTIRTLRDEVESGEFNLVGFTASQLDPAFLGDLFGTDGTQNYTGFTNPSLDAVLADALQNGDGEIRRARYAQAQQLIMEQALTLPIRDYDQIVGSSIRVQGLIYDPYGIPLLYAVGLVAPS